MCIKGSVEVVSSKIAKTILTAKAEIAKIMITKLQQLPDPRDAAKLTQGQEQHRETKKESYTYIQPIH